MTNFPGPYELRISYITNGNVGVNLTHEQRLSLDVVGSPDPGDPFSSIEVVTHSGASTPLLDDVVDAYVLLFKAVLATSSTIVGAELWKYATGTFNADFISAYTIGVAGTSAIASQTTRQDTLTFRSSNGSSLRWTVLEAGLALGAGVYAPDAGVAAVDAIVAFITDNNEWVLARDNGRPFYAMKYLVGNNESTFKKRYRP